MATPGTPTFRARVRRAVNAARRELRSPPPVTWMLADPRAANEQFTDRTVLVTGAAGTIGAVLVEAFLSAGARVHAVDIDGSGLDRLRGTMDVTAGERLVTHTVDLGDVEASLAMASSIEQLDVLVNNVGFNDGIQRVEDLTAESWHHTLDVNLVGPAMLTGQLVPRLASSGNASVLFITSIRAVQQSRTLHYGAAKAGLAKLVVDLAGQLAPHGVRVNAIAPGAVHPRDTPTDRQAAVGCLLGAGVVPIEAVVNAALFLCDSRQSPMTTGQQLVIDGGGVRR
jgi:NAD(P)-dependent dehydrogenase (short-subunit alcohol dehydrogenase family)